MRRSDQQEDGFMGCLGMCRPRVGPSECESVSEYRMAGRECGHGQGPGSGYLGGETGGRGPLHMTYLAAGAPRPPSPPLYLSAA